MYFVYDFCDKQIDVNNLLKAVIGSWQQCPTDTRTHDLSYHDEALRRSQSYFYAKRHDNHLLKADQTGLASARPDGPSDRLQGYRGRG